MDFKEAIQNGIAEGRAARAEEARTQQERAQQKQTLTAQFNASALKQGLDAIAQLPGSTFTYAVGDIADLKSPIDHGIHKDALYIATNIPVDNAETGQKTLAIVMLGKHQVNVYGDLLPANDERREATTEISAQRYLAQYPDLIGTVVQFVAKKAAAKGLIP